MLGCSAFGWHCHCPIANAQPHGFGLAPPPPSSGFGGNGIGSGVYGGGLDNVCSMYGGGIGGGGGVLSGGLGCGGGIGGGSGGRGRGGSGLVRGGGRLIGGRDSGNLFAAVAVAASRKYPPQFVAPQGVIIANHADLPLAQNAFMDYKKHVHAGLASEVWRLQSRARE